MGKLLKIVVVIVFLASIGAAALAYMNYGKRQMLTGRAEALERFVGRIAATLDAADPEPPSILPEHVARDIQDVQAREVSNPERSTFWDTYRDELESTEGAKLDLRRIAKDVDVGGVSIPQIKNYYFVGDDGKRVKTYEGYQTTGKGTMAELLDKIQERASAQSTTLNNTRKELAKIREELEDTIRELNSEKRQRRQALTTVEDLRGRVRDAENSRDEIQGKANRLETANAQINSQYKSALADLDAQKEENANLAREKADIEKKYKELRDGSRGGPVDGPGGGSDIVVGSAGSGKSTPGVKGSIVHANDEWSFVVVKLSPEAVEELTVTAEDGSRGTRPEEYMVRRGERLVTRVRIQSIRRDGSNLAIAENLSDWQQTPVAPGDEVFF